MAEQNKETASFTIIMEVEDHKALKIAAVRKGETMRDFVVQAIRDRIARLEAETAVNNGTEGI